MDFLIHFSPGAARVSLSPSRRSASIHDRDASRRRPTDAPPTSRRLARTLDHQTCDAETLAPLCAAAGADDPARNIPPRIRARTTDLRPRRLEGSPADDAPIARNLLALTVGVKQKDVVDALVRTFLSSASTSDAASSSDPASDAFSVILFHYDGEVDALLTLPWSDDVVHVSVSKQSKWWYAKRFLHPDVVRPYDHVFLWDEDIDARDSKFDQREYLRIVRENGLHISQPAIVAGNGAWPITRVVRRENETTGGEPLGEFHRLGADWNGNRCVDDDGNPTTRPPCAAYVEIIVYKSFSPIARFQHLIASPFN